MPKDAGSNDGAICMSCTAQVGKAALCCKQCDLRYCSAQCREAESYWHDAVCLSLKSLSKRPNARDGPFKRAIRFPDDHQYPEFTWANLSKDPGRHLLDISKPQLGRLTGAPPTSGEMEIRNVRGSHSRSDNAYYDLFFSHKGGVDIDKSPMNKCIATFVQQRSLQYYWQGPIEIRKKGWSGKTSEDIEMHDVRNVIEVLKEIGEYRHKDDTGPESIWVQDHALKTQPDQGRQILCTKISSEADIKNFQVEQFAPIHIAENIPAIKTAEPLEISKQLGLPLLMWRYPSVFPYDNLEPGNRLHENKLAGCMLLGTKPTDPLSTDEKSWMYPSTVVVMRKDGKDLHPRQTEALFQYCWGITLSAHKNLDSGKVEASVEQLAGQSWNSATYTQRGFEIFFPKFYTNKFLKDRSYKGTVSPYDV